MFGNTHEHGVASGTPQRIVDFAKSVEIDERKDDDAGAALCQRRVKKLEHDPVIGQSGQGVLACKLSHGLGAAVERTQQPGGRAHRQKRA